MDRSWKEKAGREPFAVASAHPLSTLAGLEVLRSGGNAYDAALAVSAALPVVQPHMNGLGADFFAVVHDRRTVAINSSGPSGRSASPEVYRRLGLREIPSRGPLSAITVPGLVAAWQILSSRAHRPFRHNLEPAVRLATQGFPASPSTARSARAALRWGDRDFRGMYGSVRPGQRLVQASMGRTIRQIGLDEGHGFYHGELARTICRDLRSKGGLLEPSDFEEYRASVLRPWRTRYRKYVVETNPPPSQGATELLWLRALSREDIGEISEPRYLSVLEETMYAAYALRARYIGDPKYLRFPARLLQRVYPSRPVVPPRLSRAGVSDTTAFSVWDGSVGISAIQSNYRGFGSGISIRGTGINLNDRGSYFTLRASHPNVLAPGKRTFHTLMATVATGPRTVLFGSMGGDVQPQVNVQVLTRHLDRGASLPDAIASPRFAYPATIYGSARLFREPGLPFRAGRLLPNDPAMFGHAQGISVGEEAEVGIDPRGDGLLPVPS